MEQKELVSKIYSVHEELRSKRREHEGKDWDLIWKEHTENSSYLQEYAQSMQALATRIWEPRNAAASDSEGTKLKLKCRLDWVHSKCREYFGERIGDLESKLELLDVGSCYNPFKKFEKLFEITAIDLCPAPGLEDEVYQCDFLELNVSEKKGDIRAVRLHQGGRRLLSLEKSSFDIVVFSFFLEYLPDKTQRLESCRKAGNLLKPGGVLFILRPDSNSVTPTGNSRLVKGLKVGCGFLGLKRIYFEKLDHLWCMGFVKLGDVESEAYLSCARFRKDLVKAKESFDFREDSFEELFSISQDFREILGGEMVEKDRRPEERVEVEPKLFDELPDFGSEDES